MVQVYWSGRTSTCAQHRKIQKPFPYRPVQTWTFGSEKQDILPLHFDVDHETWWLILRLGIAPSYCVTRISVRPESMGRPFPVWSVNSLARQHVNSRQMLAKRIKPGAYKHVVGCNFCKLPVVELLRHSLVILWHFHTVLIPTPWSQLNVDSLYR